MNTEMESEARAIYEELCEEIDKKATAWINGMILEIYKSLEKAGIVYSEDLVCELLSDGFKMGYFTALKDDDGKRILKG